MTEMSRLQPEPGWGRSTGHVRVGRLSHSEADRALDRLEIAERVYRYGWGYDERDRELLGDCFTDDAIWEGNIMGQISVGPFTGRQSIVDWLATFWDEQQDQRRHIFTNLVVQALTEDTATAYAYLLLTAATQGTVTPVTTGPYRFELSRQDDCWRLTRLIAGFDVPF
jgi:SnoaL-like domain